MSVKRNLILNGIATVIQKLVRLFEQLVLVPFFLSSWGAPFYGEWLTLTIIPSVLAFSDLGFGSAAANSFVLKFASGDQQGAANIARTGLTVISLMIVVGTALSIGVLFLLDYFNFFAKAVINSKDAIYSVSILIFARLIAFYIQLFEAYFRAARKANLAINLTTIYSITNIIASIIVLSLGYGVIIFALVQLAVTVIYLIGYGVVANKILPLQLGIEGRFDREDLKNITKKGLGYLMSPIWQSLYFQGTTFVVRLTLGAEAVAIFNTVRTLSRSVNQVFNMVNGTVFPELQYELGAGNKFEAQRLFSLSILGVFAAGLFGSMLLWFFGPVLYQIWTKNQLVVPDAVWSVFIIGILFNAMWWTAGMVFRAVNKPYHLAIMGVVSAALSVITSYFLSLKYGLIGAAYGSLVLEILMAIYVLPMSCKMLEMPMSNIFKVDILIYLKKKLKIT